nr:reverse transcriptase domain-containing protein [Tanacetum cinerariifolium]
MRNTVGKGKEQTSKNSDRPASDAAFREYCDKYYHQLLTIIAEKVPREKVQQEKLKEVKARLNFKGCSGRNSRIQEVSQHSVSRTPNTKEKKPGTRKKQSNTRGRGKTGRRQHNKRSPLSQLVVEPNNGKKHDDNWRMCVDFKDLNKACLKDGYSLTKIDWKVESLYGYPFKCFLDAYKGYHQIKMAKEDEEKTSFITSQWIFCYSKMAFGQKNAGATYQRLVDKAFQKQIGINLEVYDDLVIKSRMEHEIMRDIEETFKTPREINMKLNPKKCTFGIEEGMFLGYKVNTKGIKVCRDKAEAVLSLPSPKKMHKKSDFQWTAKAEVAFKQIKKLIAEPMEKEQLIVYLVAAREAISAVLMTEREAKFHSEASEDNPLDMPMEAEEELLELWTLFTDELSWVYGSRAGLILTNPEGAEFTYALRF